MRISKILMAGLLLSGCVTIQDQYGRGPIDLAPRVVAGFEYYKSLDKPTFFAVSTDGKNYGYSYCKGKNCSGDWDYVINIAKFSCEKKSNGVPCKIYARGTQVVWK